MNCVTSKIGEKPISEGRWFVLSAGIAFSTTGLAKIVSAFGHTKILESLDPIVGIQFKYLLLIVGCLELAVSFVCLFCERNKLAIILTAWLSTLFAGYRIGLWWLAWEYPCLCMGNLTDALHLPKQVVDLFVKVLLAYLFTASWYLVWRIVRVNKLVQ